MIKAVVENFQRFTAKLKSKNILALIKAKSNKNNACPSEVFDG